MRLDDVELLRPMGYAPVITIRVRKPAAFQRQGGIAWPQRNHRIEGFFLICRDARGQVYARGGGAFRLWTGAGFIQRARIATSLRPRFPLAQGVLNRPRLRRLGRCGERATKARAAQDAEGQAAGS